MKTLLCCLIVLCMLGVSAGLGEGNITTYGAWLPYWEKEAALEESDQLTGKLDTVIAFEAIFDSKDQLLMLPETEELLSRLQERYPDGETRVFLSVVNDILTAPEEFDLKSPELLHRLFAGEESMARHINSLLALTEDYRLSGLEIDYEALRSDTDLWDKFALFIRKLYEAFSARGLALRVVLSYDAPKYITLPPGPEYSVMCYNLYGSHSGPGPKADLDFLADVCGYYRPYASSVRMAFATGGFDWQSGGAAALTQQQAEALLADAGVIPTRDLDSGALYAVFTRKGQEHTVWYADGETLAIWKSATEGFAGYDLFRLGGNALEDWAAQLY